MLITQIIANYLKTNRRITIGGLGTFLTKQGSTEIVFSEFIKDDDGVLRSLLIESGFKELEAVGAVDRFIFDMRYALTTEGRTSYPLPGLGQMTFVGGVLSFAYDPTTTDSVDVTPTMAEPKVEPKPEPIPTPIKREPAETIKQPVVQPVAAPQPESTEEPVTEDKDLFDSFANYAGEGQNMDLKESINKWWFILPIIAIIFVLVAIFYWVAVEWMYGELELPGFLDSILGSIFLNEGNISGTIPPIE